MNEKNRFLVDRITFKKEILLENFVIKCRLSLYKNCIEFEYPAVIEKNKIENWDNMIVNKIASVDSNEYILRSISRKNGIYALFAKKANSDWEIKYIGQTIDTNSRNRIRSHLIKQTGNTKSKLKNVKTSIINGFYIGISFVNITPGSLRHFVEETLIKELNPEWNINGINK